MKNIIGFLLFFSLLVLGPLVGFGQEEEYTDSDEATMGSTPPRLSLVDGQISFWRPGAQDWSQAQINIPLAPGDQLYASDPGNLELQIGARTFIRAGSNTQIGLENLEPDFIQIKVTAGYVAVDIRALEPGRTVELDAPNAALVIDGVGYYRLDVNEKNTTFIVRRSGRATVTPADGEAFQIGANEGVTINGDTTPEVDSFQAPEADEWDQWNFTRTDQLTRSTSSRYVSPDMFGVSDLDEAGTWREVPDYGPVWTPTNVADGWAPYSDGSWIKDPSYGWTWVDAAPWGWTVSHYGRWVFLNGRWAWAPGPQVERSAYAPALVAFFGDEENRRSDGPVVSWVPLGWGEPLIPWWGPERSRRPSWDGWGGPRVRNIEHMGGYRNMGVGNAIMSVHENHFGHGPIRSAHRISMDPRGFRPLPGGPSISRNNIGFVPTDRRGIRPPDMLIDRRVIATRPPRIHAESAPRGAQFLGPMGRAMPAPRIVPAPGRFQTESNRHGGPIGPRRIQGPGSGRIDQAPPPPPPSGSSFHGKPVQSFQNPEIRTGNGGVHRPPPQMKVIQPVQPPPPQQFQGQRRIERPGPGRVISPPPPPPPVTPSPRGPVQSFRNNDIHTGNGGVHQPPPQMKVIQPVQPPHPQGNFQGQPIQRGKPPQFSPPPQISHPPAAVHNQQRVVPAGGPPHAGPGPAGPPKHVEIKKQLPPGPNNDPHHRKGPHENDQQGH
jgi:hypothetical protein